MAESEVPPESADKTAGGELIYGVLAAYGLDQEEDLPERIRRLTLTEGQDILRSLKRAYRELAAAPPGQEVPQTALSFTLPALPPSLVPSITSQLLLADVTWLDDPLYDALAGVVGCAETVSELDPTPRYRIRGLREVLEHARLGSLGSLEAYIRFYLRAKDLVLEKRIVPYKVLDMPAWVPAFVGLFAAAVAGDRELRRCLALPTGRAWAKIVRPSFARDFLRLMFSRAAEQKKLLSLLVGPAWAEAYPGKMGMLALYSLPEESLSGLLQALPLVGSLLQYAAYGTPGSSVNLGSSDLAYVFRRCLGVIEQVNSVVAREHQVPAPLLIGVPALRLPALAGIPIERVLDVMKMEKDAFASHRAWLNEELLAISAPPGSVERARELARVQEAIDRQTAEIELAYQNVRSKLVRRLAIDIPLTTFGILVASAAMFGSNLNAIAIVTSIAGGTGAAAGVKELTTHCQEYLDGVDELRLKENYFIWRLGSKS